MHGVRVMTQLELGHGRAVLGGATSRVLLLFIDM